MGKLTLFGTPRARIAAAVGVVAGLAAGWAGSSPARDIASFAELLSSATHRTVAAKDVRWEPSAGALTDLFWGRWVLFLASEGAGAPRDVWRARVRVDLEGSPLAVADVFDLTDTPLGDDHSLIARGTHAAFATFAYGQEQSVTLLDLEGDNGDSGTGRPLSFTQRVTRWLTNLQEEGTAQGIGRVDVTLDQPAIGVGLRLDEDALVADLEDGHARRSFALDLSRGELRAEPPGVHAETTRHLPKPLVIWAVDTVRAVSFIGPGPIAWLEERAFAARDLAKRLAFRMEATDSTDTLATLRPAGAGAAGKAPADLDAPHAADDGAGWPPPNIPSMWKATEPSEGQWREPKIAWMKRGLPGAPPAFLRTFVRPDEERPYIQVILVAMDMRQLDLDMEAGTEDPKPLTGAHGPGRIPRDPAVLTRVAAAFNGAFKTEHGNYGMMVHKRVLLPPQPSAASVVVLRDGRTAFGTWGATPGIGGLEGIPDGDIDSFRQNLDPLLDQGKVNPMGRALWGYTLPGSGMQTQRSGMCVTPGGQIIYAWADDVSATALAKAMKMAGCSYGMHLDMNPHHTGFIFAAIDEIKGHKYKSELLSPLMEVSPDRYIEYAPKDFFYVMQRDGAPAPAGTTVWKADAGIQPPPAWLPGVWEARVDGAPGAAIDLVDIESGRASYRIRAGTKEPDPKTGATPVYELGEADAHKVLLAIGLGLSPERKPRGLATDGRMVLPLRALKAQGSPEGGAAAYGVVVAQADGRLSIEPAEELKAVGPHVDVVEEPLILDAGEVVARAGTAEERAALGSTPDGRVILARGDATTDAALAQALRAVGCRVAVALDRGAHTPSFVHRAGTATPPKARYESSALYVLAAPMPPRAFRFEALAAVAQASSK